MAPNLPERLVELLRSATERAHHDAIERPAKLSFLDEVESFVAERSREFTPSLRKRSL
jgi:hypothetical protein